MWAHPFWTKYAPVATVMGAVGTYLALAGLGNQGASTHSNTTIIYPAPAVQPVASGPDRAAPNEADASTASSSIEIAPPAVRKIETALSEPEREPPSQSTPSTGYVERSRPPAAPARRAQRLEREEPMQQATREPAPLVFRHVAQ